MGGLLDEEAPGLLEKDRGILISYVRNVFTNLASLMLGPLKKALYATQRKEEGGKDTRQF